jgi:hypothetical protein
MKHFSSLSCPEVVTNGGGIPLLSNVFMEWRLIKHEDYFTFLPQSQSILYSYLRYKDLNIKIYKGVISRDVDSALESLQCVNMDSVANDLEVSA